MTLTLEKPVVDISGLQGKAGTCTPSNCSMVNPDEVQVRPTLDRSLLVTSEMPVVDISGLQGKAGTCTPSNCSMVNPDEVQVRPTLDRQTV
jgi:hypothetical protein